jgi:hypothetical protein
VCRKYHCKQLQMQAFLYSVVISDRKYRNYWTRLNVVVWYDC